MVKFYAIIVTILLVLAVKGCVMNMNDYNRLLQEAIDYNFMSKCEDGSGYDWHGVCDFEVK